MIVTENLHKKFGQNKVLKGVNLNISGGGIFAILGPNGSGKTTLIKSILGMVIPDRGDVMVCGQSIKNGWQYRNEIDYLPQIAQFPENLTANELIGMVKDIRKKPDRAQPFIDMFGLTVFLDKPLRHLSGGTRQKINLLLAFMFDSPIIILDEPTTGLDPIAFLQLKKTLQEERKKGKTILVTSHIMSFVEEMADDIVFLLDGEIHFKGDIETLKLTTKKDSFLHAIAHLLKTQQ